MISPGAVATELLNTISEPDVAEAVRKRTAQIAIPAESFARVVAFAISQPEDVDVNEMPVPANTPGVVSLANK